MRVNLCYELVSPAERNERERERVKKHVNGTWEKHTVY
jgi:hypothetical protein